MFGVNVNNSDVGFITIRYFAGIVFSKQIA